MKHSEMAAALREAAADMQLIAIMDVIGRCPMKWYRPISAISWRTRDFGDRLLCKPSGIRMREASLVNSSEAEIVAQKAHC
jgi:hypothetical protein